MSKIEFIPDEQLHGECIVFKALKPFNLRNHAITDATFDSSGKASNTFRHVFFFPPTELKTGDRVILFTGKPTFDCEIGDVSKTHIFNWNSSHSVWNNTGDQCTFFEVSSFEKYSIPAKTSGTKPHEKWY